MGFFGFYKIRKPRAYAPKPIYWDPEKERMQEREARIKKEMGLVSQDEEFQSNVKGSLVGSTTHLRRKVERGETSSSRTDKSIKIAVALVLLLILGYYLFYR